MLARLPSSLPSAAISVARSAPLSIQRLPSCARFNSTEAASEPQPQGSSDGPAQAAPKKRAIPLVEDLGGISLTKKWGQGKNRGPRLQAKEGGVVHGQQPRPPRQNNEFRRDGQAQAGARPRQDRPRNGDQQRRPAHATHRQIAPRQWSQNATPKGKEEAQDPKLTPSLANAKVQLSNIDDLFGSPVPLTTSHKRPVTSARRVTPSETRVQLLLERTAGEYSRYVPRPFPETNVTKLGPLKLAEFTLSRQRDVTPQGRQNVLAVVEKFSGTGARAATA